MVIFLVSRAPDWFAVNADRLCPALKAVFEHGLKRSSLLGGPGHPWLFIEEVTCLVFFCMVNGMVW